MRSLILSLACILTCFATAQDFPESIQHLAAVIDQEETFTEGLRTFHRAEKALAEAEIAMAEEHRKAGEDSLAEEKGAAAKARMDSIVGAYEFALLRYPNSALIHNYYGEILYDYRHNVNGALQEWHKAIGLNDELSGAHNNLGLHEFHYGNYESGLRYLDRALDIEDDNPDYLFNMTQVYLIHGPQIGEIRGWKPKKVYKEAMKMSEKAAENAPDDYALLVDYAVNFFAAENFDVEADWRDAAKAWAAAREHASTPQENFYCWLNEGRVWLRDEDDRKAKPCLEEALRIRPEADAVRALINEIDARARD